MIFGITVLVISFSFLCWNHPPRTWAALLRDLQSKRIAPPPPDSGDKKPSSAPQEDANKEAPEQKTASESRHTTPLPKISEKPTAPVTIDIPASLDGTPETSPQTTPKATTFPPVPSFTVAEHTSTASDSEDDDDNLPPPQFPALNSAQRASGPAPAASAALRAPPTLKPLSAPSLMPPPARSVPNGALQVQRAGGAGGLMPPPARPTPAPLRGPSGPLPNRGPPGSSISSSSNSLGLPSSVPVKTPNPRQKVLLRPGHSPLDWAALCKSPTANLSGVAALQRVTPSMLKVHNGRRNRVTGETMPAWSSYQGKVYNITPYLPFHPGGEGELRRVAGKDGEKLFNEVHPWVNWDNMLSECVVGILVPEYGETEEKESGGLDDMD